MSRTLMRRVLGLEAANDTAERLIVVALPVEANADAVIAQCSVEQRQRDLVVIVTKPDPAPAWVRVGNGPVVRHQHQGESA